MTFLERARFEREEEERVKKDFPTIQLPRGEALRGGWIRPLVLAKSEVQTPGLVPGAYRNKSHVAP